MVFKGYSYLWSNQDRSLADGLCFPDTFVFDQSALMKRTYDRCKMQECFIFSENELNFYIINVSGIIDVGL